MLLEVFMLEVIQATFSRQCSLINQKETFTYLFYESITRNRKRSVPSSAKWVISAGGWKPPLTHMTHIILRWVVKHWQQRQQQGRKRQLRHCNVNALTRKTTKMWMQASTAPHDSQNPPPALTHSFELLQESTDKLNECRVSGLTWC